MSGPAVLRRRLAISSYAIGLALASAANAAPYNPDQLPGTQIAQVEHACRSIVGLEPGEAQYAACVASLSDTVRGADEVRSRAEARQTCRREGFDRGTPGLAECTLDAADKMATTSSGAANVAPQPDTSPPAARSYFQASRADVYRREESACAGLGFDPTGAEFTGCVTGLRSAIFNANYPD